MTKKLSKLVGYSFLSILLALVLLAGYTQTGAFRSNVRSILFKMLEDNINGSVFIGELNGNIFNSFTIDTVMLYVDNAPFIQTGKVTVHYRIISLLRQKINIDSVTIEHPTVHLTRWKDGSWNVNRLSKSKTPPDSLPSPWIFVARKIQVQNGTFQLLDSTGRYDSAAFIEGRKSFNYSNLLLSSINLEAFAIYSSDNLEAKISHLSLAAPKEKFVLNKLALNCFYSKDSARVSGLSIETPRTKLSLSSHISGVDVFSVKDLAEFENAPVATTINESVVSCEDLQTFLPVLYFLKGNVHLKGAFQGTFQQLNVKNLNASFAKTDLHLSGAVSNIHQPKELRLNIVSQQSAINPPDVPELLPYFNIPLYQQLGLLTMDFQFVGKPLDFVVLSTVKSAGGTMTVDGQMVITEDNLHYKGVFAGRDVDLEKIFETPELASRLNTRAYIEGDGASIDKLNAEARIEIDSSIVRGIPVSSATLEAKAKAKTIDTDVSINSPEGKIHTAALFDFRKETPAYMLSARVRECNLASIFQDEYYASRISFDLNRAAQTFSLFDGASNTTVQILPSTFRQYSIDSAQAKMRVDVDSSGSRHVTFQSPVADGEMRGVFTFNGFLNTLQASARQFQKLYSYQRHVVDSTFAENVDVFTESAENQEDNNISFTVQAKNLRPIAIFFNAGMFDAQATVSGELRGNNQHAKLSCAAKLDRGMFFQDSTLIQARQTGLQFSLEDIPVLKHHYFPLKVEMKIEGDEIAINRTSFHYPKINLQYNGLQGGYTLYTDVDTTMSAAVEGTIDIREGEERFLFSRLYTKYQGYELENNGDFSAVLSHKKITVDSAMFSRRDQTLLINGSFEFDGAVDVTAKAANFAANDLYYFNTSPEFKENALAFGGSFNAAVRLTGTVENPDYAVELNGEGISYRSVNFGRVSGVMVYKNLQASVKVEVSSGRDSAAKRDLYLEGIVPIDLRLVKAERRTAYEGLDAKLIASNLNISAFDPFIPELKDIKGNIRCDIAITGSLEKPLFKGTALLDSGYFVLEMTGISYLASGKLNIEHNKITFPEFAVTNLPKEYYNGRMKIGGDVALEGFSPKEYHLNASGELMVLQERSRTPGSNFFGTLVASTGKDSIRFDGTFEHSSISGTIFIQQASLTFPPTQQASTSSSSGFGRVEFIDDTSKAALDTSLAVSLTKFAEQVLSNSAPQSPQPTFTDGLNYDLTIITQGNVHVNMIFNANVGAYEELFAELNGKLTLTKDETGLHLTGTINVGSGSTYEFYKKFNATGSLTFVGDPQNPQLKILAEYEGTHVKDPLKSNEEEHVIVSLEITGTRLHPKVKLGLSTVDQTGKETARPGEVDNDAISFLLTSAPGTPGKFRDELTTQDRNKIGEQLYYSTIGGTFINNMLSGAVMDFISKNNIPFVKRFEVSEVGADPSINVRVEVFDWVINAGGRVFSNINNTNFSIQRPVLGKENRNFMLEVEKKTENFNYSLESRTILSARLFYRFTF